MGQKRQRDEKAERDRREAGRRCEPPLRALQRDAPRDSRMAVDAGEGLAAAAVALERDQAGDRDQHHAGDLRRARQARTVEPGGEDRQRQRLHAEIFAGADVVERLEQRQRKTRGDRRARQRQRDVAGQRPATRAERARHLDQRRALGLEHRAGGEIDVRVEHEAHDQDRAAERADVRKPVVGGRLEAEQRAQRRLHRSEAVEHVDIDVGDDVGRERERQRQQPDEHAAAGKFVGRDDPGGADAGDGGDQRDSAEQQRAC